jgi:hypothetical protein
MTARPFRLVAPEPPERVLQENVARVLDLLLAPPAIWFSAAIGATQLSPQQAAVLVRQGVKRGLPDVLVIAPPQGRLYGIELKVGKGTLSKTRLARTRRGAPRILVGQVERFAELEAAGMEPIAICRDVSEVLAQLEQWKIPLRGRTVNNASSTTSLAIE